MTNLIDLKCARIWAFDEMIDTNTYHDGLSSIISIQQLSYTFNKVKIENNLNDDITNEYLTILNNMKIFYNISIQDIEDSISSLTRLSSVYYLCGWKEHAITIFVTNIDDNNFDLGIINCGQGIEFQGFDDVLCNGLIIFHNIEYLRILKFLTMYKNYFTITNNLNHPNFMIYRSFYLLLFDIILEQTEVDFKKEIDNDNIRVYKLPKQTIGSCFFTNTVFIVYYLYIKQNILYNDNNIYILYSEWYNTIKTYIKIIIHGEILQEKDTIKYLKYYNIYKYISDIKYINSSNSDYSIYKSQTSNTYSSKLAIINIDQVNYDYTILTSNPVLSIRVRNKEADKYNFYGLYDNIKTFSDIYNEWKDTNEYSNEDLLYSLFIFFKDMPLFNNNMKLLVPLLILYNFKKTTRDINSLFWETLTYPKILNILKSETEDDYSNYDYISHEENITICIYILLVNDIGNLDITKLYYDNNIDDYELTRQDNFDFYNKYIFQYIPIINDYYLEIIKVLIQDLYTNIGILPNIKNKSHYNKDNNHGKDDIIYTHNENKYYIKCLTNFYSLKKKYITTHYYYSYNFILWYIFIHSISNERLCRYSKAIYYELYGCINIEAVAPSIQQDNLSFIMYKNNTYSKDSINEINNYNGTNTLYKQIIKVFFPYIKEKLNEYDIETKFLLPDILKLYIIHFYLCCLIGPNKQDIIYNNSIMFNKFNTFAIEYFKDIYYIPFITIIDTYIDIYNLTFSSEKKKLIINEKILISNIEKKYFTVKEYSYTEYENLCSSIIKFYCIYTTDYTLVFPSDNIINTSASIKIIKNLLNKNVSIYLLLNFSFNEKNGIITGIYKYNNNNKLTCNISDYKLIYNEGEEKYICLSATNLKEHSHINFYNLMSYNDNGLFLYKHEIDEIYYLRSFRYTFIFIMKNKNVYITIDNIEYIVKWYNDEDNYNIYGILKLYKFKKIDTTEIIEKIDSKIICIYNYDIIIQLINSKFFCIGCDYEKDKINECKDFIDNNFKSSETDIFKNLQDLPDEYKVYYYTTLNKYNDKYILTNISDVLALLINCLFYNSPFLILKNIEQIKIILNNNDHNKNNLNKLLNTLFLNFDNIYSLPILFLFYENEKNIGNFYYKSSNIIYNLYKILLRLEINDTFRNNFSYSKIAVILYDSTKNIIPIHEETKKIFLYFNKTTSSNYEGILESTLKVIINIQIHDYYNETTDYKLTVSNTPMPNMLKYCKLLIQSEENTTNEDDFKKLVILFCPMFCNNGCNDNISKARKLYDYLIREGKDFIHPIQEMIMGSGKSTVLTSYICILLLKYFLLNRSTEKEIYIVMPIPLINDSFEILMKFVFPLFNNIEVLIYPNKVLYDKSIHIYLINDIDYKIMFLKEPINTDNKYMIYDEVDMMANPLTCELNSPLNSDVLPFDELFIIANKLYTNIFDEASMFWNDIEKKNKLDSHNYIYEIDNTNSKQIIDKFDKMFPKDNSIPIMKYIKDNILIFILTKQFNLDYGMPENYNLDSKTIYKFKAIPYSAVDSPIMGSEFSDPILTYILTLFCYKFVKGKYRKIDKDYILEYYDNLYSQNKNDIRSFTLLKNLFTNNDLTFEYTNYKKNKEYYMTIYNDTFNISDEFDIIIKKILEMNKIYYKKCKNISFNDLLLSRNVKNFICFTGTAYIDPPKGFPDDKNFELITEVDNEKNISRKIVKIDYYKKNDNTVLDSVKSIIMNRIIMIKMYSNKYSSLLITNIFNCLEKYDVLIDIGGVFTNYNITRFITEYNKTTLRKNYIVYFDNGRKVYNLETKQFETDKSIIQTQKNAFFFFSNKDITGVDVKNIMNSTVHALVVITNKTNMRDFSQGIFRMRRLLENEHETFDIVFDDKFYNIINSDNKRPKQLDLSIDECFYDTTNDYSQLESIPRINIIKHLQSQQDKITNQKKLSLIKQNIFGLTRTPNTEIYIYLFLYPGSIAYSEVYDKSKYNSLYNTNLNIDKINILSIDSILQTKSTIIGLIQNYFNLSNSVENIVNATIHTTSELETSTETIVETITETNTTQLVFTDTARVMDKGTIYLNFKYKDVDNNQIENNILCLHESTIKNDLLSIYDDSSLYDILLVYSWEYNNLIILNTYQLIIFLTNITNIEKYTFISLCDLAVYGKNMIDVKKSYLLSKFVHILKNITISPSHLKRRNLDDINKLQLVQALNKLIVYLTINTKKVDKNNIEPNLTIKHSAKYSSKNYLIKYMKYKDKYLNLIKNNS